MSSWPESPEVLAEPSGDDKEVKNEAKAYIAKAVESAGSIDDLLNSYSSWYQLKRAVVWLIRFFHWIVNWKQGYSGA